MQVDLETAAFFLACAADKAHTDFHVVGRQPMIEAQRLTAANEATVDIGQKGEDDDAIQYEVRRGKLRFTCLQKDESATNTSDRGSKYK